jgi:tRNA (cytidine56-2'-O)-methyltransferase
VNHPRPEGAAPDPLAPPPADGGRGAQWRGGGAGAIGVLRIGHRVGRDKRTTTHVALTARALGADVVYIHEPDPRIETGVRDVVTRFGGPFDVHSVASWRAVIGAWNAAHAQIVHLTMYGVPLDEGLGRVDPKLATLFVVGAEKVPFEVYERATVNIAVGSQPHSEVAALAVVLDRFLGGAWAGKTFAGKVQVSPRERGKAVSQRSEP